jgi:hypothetical protein
MMIFLIEYSRPEGRILNVQAFKASERRRAEVLRVEKELELHRGGLNYEIVLLEAHDERALRKTHGRYFEDLRELARSTTQEE